MERLIIQRGKSAIDQLAIHAMQKWVIRMAARFHENHGRHSGFTLQDFVQSGAIGALQAATNYDPQRYRNAFSTFAMPRIRGAMWDAIRESGGTIKIPRSVFWAARKNTVKAVLQQELGRNPTQAEVERRFRETSDERFISFLPMDEPAYFVDRTGEGVRATIGDTLPGKSHERPDMLSLVNAIGRKLKVDMRALSEQERHVVRRYYYDDLTLLEIGREMGVSESRASQIKTMALSKLRLSGSLLEMIGEALFGEHAV